MEAAGIDYQTVQAETEDGATELRAYNADSPEYKGANATCVAEANAATGAGTVAPTHDDYLRLAAFVDCLRSAGFDVGFTVSEEEWLSLGGNVDPSTEWSALSEFPTDGFGAAYDECTIVLGS